MLFWITSNKLKAQHEAFESLSVGIYYQKYLPADATFDLFWKPEHNLGFGLTTPFFLGQLRTGVDLTPFVVKEDAESDFKVYLFYLSWGERFRIFRNVHFDLFGVVGDNLMIFDTDNIRERELSYGFLTGLSWHFKERWSLESHLRYRKILTFKSIKLMSVSFGVAFDLTIGEKLKRILQ